MLQALGSLSVTFASPVCAREGSSPHRHFLLHCFLSAKLIDTPATDERAADWCLTTRTPGPLHHHSPSLSRSRTWTRTEACAQARTFGPPSPARGRSVQAVQASNRWGRNSRGRESPARYQCHLHAIQCHLSFLGAIPVPARCCLSPVTVPSRRHLGDTSAPSEFVPSRSNPSATSVSSRFRFGKTTLQSRCISVRSLRSWPQP